jgi:GNAT superfamily N-acetyltransferase
MTGTLIRPAVLADVPQIAQVHVDSWHTTYPGIFAQSVIAGQTLERRLALWTRFIDQAAGRQTMFVAVQADAVVGFASLGPFRVQGPPIEGEGELNAIYLLQRVQGQGIGRRLVSVAAAWLQQAGFAAMRCWVVRGNQRADAFYAGLGGVVVGTSSFDVEGVLTVEDCFRFELPFPDLNPDS